MLTALAACTLVLPLAAGAKDSPHGLKETFVSPGLLDKAAKEPGQKLHVIVQSSAGTSDAVNKIVGLGAGIRKRLDLIGAVAIDITAGKLASLSKQPGLTGASGFDPGGTEARERRSARLHPALGHVVRRPGRGGRGCSAQCSASGLEHPTR